jgi:hypothetical protein
MPGAFDHGILEERIDDNNPFPGYRNVLPEEGNIPRQERRLLLKCAWSRDLP